MTKKFIMFVVLGFSIPLFNFLVLVPVAMGQSAKKPSAGSQAKSAPPAAAAAPTAEPIKVSVADDQLTFAATGDWKSVKPRSSILEAELQIPAVAGDERNSRLTIMGAGGSIDANIARWEGQFGQADGSATEAATTNETISGMHVSLVEISGTFADSMGRGPFAGGKKVERPDYGMLAAIIETDRSGNYFVKLVGPQATLAANKDAFEQMIRSLKVK